MKLAQFLFRRGLQSIFVLFGLSIVIFIIARVAPGDPARMALGFRASEDAVARMRETMRLNDPLYVQYLVWLGDALQGNFGVSHVTHRAITEDIHDFLPATLELVFLAGLIMGVPGVYLGMLSGRHKDKWIDNVIRIVSYLGVVTPSFVFAVLFLLIFGFILKWLPTVGRLSSDLIIPARLTGFYTIDALLAGNLVVFWDAFVHLIFPALALALPAMAQQARITRATLSDNLGKDYIAAARALGVPEGLVMGRLLLKPSLIPSVSILGLDFAAAVVNAFLVELVFNWPGLSRYGITAMLRKDLNAIVAVILVYGAIFIVANIVVDLVVAQLDPRIKLNAGRGG